MEDYKFFKMSKLPIKNDNDQSVSMIVLVYDKISNNEFLNNLGYYDFEINEWNHFGRESMKLICWCYLPNPREFISYNESKTNLPKIYIAK